MILLFLFCIFGPWNTKLLFFGKKEKIIEVINTNKLNVSNYDIVDCSDNVSDEDKPNTILRSRKDSSIYKGLKFVRNNPNSGFVSAGNTAALMILSRLILGMISGIDRPAICSDIPNKKSFSLMLDFSPLSPPGVPRTHRVTPPGVSRTLSDTPSGVHASPPCVRHLMRKI